MEPAREMIRYHAWVTTRLLDHCLSVPEAALTLHLPWTLGTIPAIFEHMIAGEWWGLRQLGMAAPSDDSTPGLAQWREQAVAQERAWADINDTLPQSDLTLPARPGIHPRIPNAGSMFLLQAWHHGELHRTEVRATLAAAGVPYPGRDETDVWAFWMARG